jgi:hypothetical protein
MLRGIAAACAAVMLLAAAPAPGSQLDPVQPGMQTARVRAYIDALAARRYAAAFAMLDAAGRAYFRTAGNFAGVYTADDLTIASYVLAGMRGSRSARVYYAREQIRLRNPSTDALGSATVTVSYGVAADGRIADPGHPRRSSTTPATQTRAGLRVRVHKISLYPHTISVVVTFANVGDGFLTVLPYGRSVLRDDAGNVYRLIETRAKGPVDTRLFLGVHLAADAQVTGVLSFASPRLDDRARHFTLTVGPNLRDGAAAPFTVDVDGIAA